MIAKEGGVSLLMNLVRSQREEEQVAAAQCLWTLAFHQSIQKDLQSHRGKLETLSKSCHNKVMRKSLQGILLTIEKPAGTIKEKKCKDDHIMISYAWDGGYGEKTVRKIAGNLKSRGLKVWIDSDGMTGSILDAMAQAVSDSYAFILCVSDKYRTSNPCRMEATFALKQQKLIIPVVVGSSIDSIHDWLMLLCGDKFYVNFTDESKFHQNCEELVQQIVRLSKGVDETDVVAKTVQEITTLPQASESVETWSSYEVKNWLRDRSLQCFEDEFQDFNGSDLIGLKTMQCEAPDFFYRYFCEHKDGGEKRRLINGLKLRKAIESL